MLWLHGARRFAGRNVMCTLRHRYRKIGLILGSACHGCDLSILLLINIRMMISSAKFHIFRLRAPHSLFNTTQHNKKTHSELNTRRMKKFSTKFKYQQSFSKFQIYFMYTLHTLAVALTCSLQQRMLNWIKYLNSVVFYYHEYITHNV